MALNLKGLSKKLGEAKSVLSDAKEHLTEAKDTLVDAKDDWVKKAQESLPENMKDINVQESMMEMARKGTAAFAKFAKEAKQTDIAAKEVLSEQKAKDITLNPSEALKIIYYMMAIDQNVTIDELETFQSIGNDMDPEFNNYKETLISECNGVIGNVLDENDHYDNIHDQISNIILSSSGGIIKGKLLLWNLLAVVYSDEDYTESEKRLAKSIARTMKIAPDILMEMENTVSTIRAINEEEAFVKASDRRYVEVEAIVNELADRRNAIMRGMYALLTE